MPEQNVMVRGKVPGMYFLLSCSERAPGIIEKFKTMCGAYLSLVVAVSNWR